MKEDIKNFYDMSGHLNKKLTFLLTDSEVKKEQFLEYINMILSTGEIPGLIPKDEKDAWLSDCRNDYNKEHKLSNYDPTPAELYQFFQERLKGNLHIVLCFSPVGIKFRERARKFPFCH